jgi:hypothetical protein
MVLDTEDDVPSKLNVIGWRLLLEKLPIRAALNHKGILFNTHNLTCVFCFRHIEDCPDLFFNYSFT